MIKKMNSGIEHGIRYAMKVNNENNMLFDKKKHILLQFNAKNVIFSFLIR